MRGLRAGCERCGEAMDVLHHVDHQRLRAVAHCQCMAGIRREVEPYPPRNVLREHQLTVVLLGQPLELAGDVDSIPHGGQGGRLAIAHPADDRMGIGTHPGPAVVGWMGYGETTSLTAVGDTVHVASQLEGLTKEYHCQLVLSEHVARRVGTDLTAYPRHELTVRNRTEPLAIYVVEDVHRLAAALAAGS